MTESDEKTYGRLRTIAEASEWLGLSIETLRKKIQHGLIESHKLFGRRMISEEEIIRVIEESRVRVRGETRTRVDVVTTPTRGRGSR
jgi:excisionase family DNA binding protein